MKTACMGCAKTGSISRLLQACNRFQGCSTTPASLRVSAGRYGANQKHCCINTLGLLLGFTCSITCGPAVRRLTAQLISTLHGETVLLDRVAAALGHLMPAQRRITTSCLATYLRCVRVSRNSRRVDPQDVQLPRFLLNDASSATLLCSHGPPGAPGSTTSALATRIAVVGPWASFVNSSASMLRFVHHVPRKIRVGRLRDAVSCQTRLLPPYDHRARVRSLAGRPTSGILQRSRCRSGFKTLQWLARTLHTC